MICINKKRGETPLQALNRLRAERTEYADATLSYAGRLDPMADGVMLVLVGDENKRREPYLGLDKMYVAEVLFGLGTDTGDVLGVVKSHKSIQSVKVEDAEREIQKSIGKFSQKYPAYSSKSFAGSYEDVRDGSDVQTHVHDVEVYSAELVSMRKVGGQELLENIRTDVAKVAGDFRQSEIVQVFESELATSDAVFTLATVRLSVSSGFYVRQFAEDLGEKLGVPALAYSIRREQVGECGLGDCVL